MSPNFMLLGTGITLFLILTLGKIMMMSEIIHFHFKYVCHMSL
jgi:hypothetical protein